MKTNISALMSLISEEERKARKAKNYRRAQLGKLNTMYNRKGKNSPFIQVVLQ